MSRTSLQRTVSRDLRELVLLLVAGCVTGAVLGVYGRQLLDRALADVINFAVAYSVAVLPALLGLAVVTASAAEVMAITG